MLSKFSFVLLNTKPDMFRYSRGSKHRNNACAKLCILHLKQLKKGRRRDGEQQITCQIAKQHEGDAHECTVGGSNNEGTSELQPPSYIEALEREEAAEAVAAFETGAARRDAHHYVVQIEVSSSVASEDDGDSDGRVGSDEPGHEDHADSGNA